MNIFKILFSIWAILSVCFSNELTQKDLNDKNFSINKGSYKIVEFDKMVKNIKVSDQKFIELDFVEDSSKPLQAIKIFAKELGYGNILITFVDSSSMLININISENINDVIEIAKKLAPNLKIKQINGKVVLEGDVENQKTKDSIINLLRKTNLELKDQLIDLSTLKDPDKMIRIKLYVVEIDNNKSEEITNDWSVLNFDDGKTSAGVSFENDGISVSGGLSAIANRIGSKFDVGLALTYLKSNDIAKILDETTLITLENNKSKFHSGGTINARTSTTDSVQFTQIEYGLKMEINVQQIIDGQYVKLLISTESSTIDATTVVDEIPAIKNKTIETNVIIGNLSTIVLGGLINIGNANYEEKIPLLGDIPLLGKLFTSSSESTDNKELVFFITPEIVDPKSNNQLNLLDEKKSSFAQYQIDEKPKAKKVEVENKTKEETEHEKRVREILGY
jgi:Flp pilus assembly secretin CpaC